VSQQVLALQDVQVRQRHRGRDRVPAVGEAVREGGAAARNGSASRSLTMVAPIGEYPDVMPLAQVMMSGR
jgi:hypothetical protein